MFIKTRVVKYHLVAPVEVKSKSPVGIRALYSPCPESSHSWQVVTVTPD